MGIYAVCDLTVNNLSGVKRGNKEFVCPAEEPSSASESTLLKQSPAVSSVHSSSFPPGFILKKEQQRRSATPVRCKCQEGSASDHIHKLHIDKL